jgi:hypothetical protein
MKKVMLKNWKGTPMSIATPRIKRELSIALS